MRSAEEARKARLTPLSPDKDKTRSNEEKNFERRKKKTSNKARDRGGDRGKRFSDKEGGGSSESHQEGA